MGGFMICQLWDHSKPISMGIPHTDRSAFYSWKGKVFFSATMRGDTLDCHVAAKGRNKLLLREAINQFCQYMFLTYSQCNKIAACVKMKSVRNLCLKCGFVKIADINDSEVLVRWAE